MPGSTAFALSFIDGFFAGLLGFSFPVVLLHVLVAHSLWSTERAARLKVAIRAVHCGHSETRISANNVLLDPRAVSRSVKLLLVHKSHERVDEADAFRLHRRFIQRQQKLDLVVNRNLERIFFKRALPPGDNLFGGTSEMRLR